MLQNQAGDGEKPYVVKRGKPPREHQFKPGQSGNPAGRPKGSKAIDMLMEEELDRKIEVTLSGRRTRLSKRQVMIRQLVDKALKGDYKAITTCLALQNAKKTSAPKTSSSQSNDDTIDTLLTNDEQILMAFLARNSKGLPHG